jgi:hypothetical protein
MTKSEKKLLLKRETVANLSPAQLRHVGGGTIVNVYTQAIYGQQGGPLSYFNFQAMTPPDSTP